MPITLALIVLSSRAAALSGRIGPRLFMTLGPLAMAGGALLMLTVSEPFSYLTQLLRGVMLFGVGVAATVSPLTSAVLGAVDSARSGLASAVNNAVARVAGLVMVAALGAVVGGEFDLAGCHRAVAFTAVLLALGGVASWVGIRTSRPLPTGQLAPTVPSAKESLRQRVLAGDVQSGVGETRELGGADAWPSVQQGQPSVGKSARANERARE